MYGYETVVPCTLLPSAYDVADESLNRQGVIEPMNFIDRTVTPGNHLQETKVTLNEVTCS